MPLERPASAVSANSQPVKKPLSSMTGHGRGISLTGSLRVAAEIVGLNRKNLDIACTLPKELAAFEPRAREMIASAVHRGRISLALVIEHAENPPGPAQVIDSALAGAYLNAIRTLQRELGVPGEIRIADLISLPGVAATPSPTADPARLLPACEAALAEALNQFRAMRIREGAALARDLAKRAAAIAKHLRPIARENALAVRAKSEGLKTRVRQISGPADDERFLREILLIAERSDIAEELARIESHIGQFRAALATGGPVGRQLEFLSQELAREFHTLGSKTASPEASRRIIDCKLDVERLREQVQNIE